MNNEYYELVEDIIALLGQILGECIFDDLNLQKMVEEKYDELVEIYEKE